MSIRKVFTMKRVMVLAALILAMALIPMMSSKAYAAEDVGYGGTNYGNAPTLSLGKEYTGIASGDHAHFFKFTTTGNKGVKYKFRCSNYSEYDYAGFISFSIRDEDGNKVDYIAVYKSESPLTESFTNLKRNTTYYIEVNNLRLGNDDFALKISQVIPKPKKVSIKTPKAGKKKLIVKWKKVAYATKYQVKYRKSGSSKWKIKTTKKTKITLKKLKSGKKYQVRVRAVRVVYGKNYKGKYSKTITKKVK